LSSNSSIGGGQRPFVQFGQFVPQQFQAMFAIVAASQFADACAELTPLLGQVSHLRDARFVFGVGVEQVQLMAAFQQRLVFVLAVDFHQQRGQFAHLADGGRAAVDPGARAAFGANHAAQLAGTVFVQFLAREPVARFGQVGQIELCRQLRAIAAGAHDAAVGACAGQQHQSVHQQGLAGAGFPADDGQPGTERKIGFFDDGEMADVKGGEHGVVLAVVVRIVSGNVGQGTGSVRRS
jgi:hypothetical protein